MDLVELNEGSDDSPSQVLVLVSVVETPALLSINDEFLPHRATVA